MSWWVDELMSCPWACWYGTGCCGTVCQTAEGRTVCVWGGWGFNNPVGFPPTLLSMDGSFVLVMCWAGRSHVFSHCIQPQSIENAIKHHIGKMHFVDMTPYQSWGNHVHRRLHHSVPLYLGDDLAADEWATPICCHLTGLALVADKNCGSPCVSYVTSEQHVWLSSWPPVWGQLLRETWECVDGGNDWDHMANLSFPLWKLAWAPGVLKSGLHMCT